MELDSFAQRPDRHFHPEFVRAPAPRLPVQEPPAGHRSPRQRRPPHHAGGRLQLARERRLRGKGVRPDDQRVQEPTDDPRGARSPPAHAAHCQL